MAENKRSFVLYADQYELFKKLPNEQAGELIKHIFAYVNDENPTTDNLLIEIAFEPIKAQLKRDLKRWEHKIEARSRAGKASAEAKKINKDQQTSTNSTYVDFVQQTSTQSTDNVNDNVNVNVNVNDNVINKKNIGDKSPSAPIDIYTNAEKHPTSFQLEFRAINERIHKNYPGVLKIKKQMTIDQYAELRKTWSMDDIETKLAVIENQTKHQKNQSVYLTINTWLKTYPPIKQKSTQKLNEDGEPIDIVKKYELRNQQLRDANR